MSEVNEKDLELQEKSVFDLFSESQDTLEEAQKRKAAEELKFSKFKNFIMDKAGEYNIRILPLSPKSERRGYEYPVRQKWITIKAPDGGKDVKIKLCKPTEAGFSIDLIDTYKKLALNKVRGDKDIEDKIKSGSFGGGLKYDFNHAMFIYDLDNIEEGMMIWEASNGQFKSLEDQKDSTWKRLIEKSNDKKYPCPICSWNNGYPVTIQKKKGAKTEYAFSVDVISGPKKLTEEQLKSLIDAPTLPEIIYRYTRFHLEATIEYLKQYDETSDLDIMQEEEMINAIEILKGELPADDTSHFTFNSKDDGKSDEDNDTDITFDKLSAIYDDLQEKGLGDKSEEGQNLRSLIAEYIKGKNLSVGIKRGKSNCDLLDEIEAELEALGGEPKSKKTETASVTNKQSEDSSLEPSAEEESSDKVEEEKPEVTQEKPASTRRRRQ